MYTCVSLSGVYRFTGVILMLIITVSLLIVVHYHRQRLRRCAGNVRTLVYARTRERETEREGEMSWCNEIRARIDRSENRNAKTVA